MASSHKRKLLADKEEEKEGEETMLAVPLAELGIPSYLQANSPTRGCKKRAKRTVAEAEEDLQAYGPCLPDDPYLLTIILDFSLASTTVDRWGVQLDHPLRAVNRATRQAWLAHPISLPFRLRVEHLRSSAPASRLPLGHRLVLASMFESAIGDFVKQAKREQKERLREVATREDRRQLMARVDPWAQRRAETLGMQEKEAIEEASAARDLIGRATDVVFKSKSASPCSCGERASTHHYEESSYRWYKQRVSFEIEGERFRMVDGHEVNAECPCRDELEMPEVARLEELREKWRTPLSADALHDLFRYLLHCASTYNFRMVSSSRKSDSD